MCSSSPATIYTSSLVLEPFVSGKYHSVQHRLKQKEITLHTGSTYMSHKHWRNSRTIHSEIIMSTLSTGNCTSSTFPLMRVILSSKPFSLQANVNFTTGGHSFCVTINYCTYVLYTWLYIDDPNNTERGIKYKRVIKKYRDKNNNEVMSTCSATW